MAHKKAAGSTRLGRDSKAKRLGVKVFGNQFAQAGNIIVKQRGTKFAAGDNVGRGVDDSLFALVTGLVSFKRVMKRKFTGTLRPTRVVSVVPTVAEKKAAKKYVPKTTPKAATKKATSKK